MADDAVFAVQSESPPDELRMVELGGRNIAGVKGDGAPLNEFQQGSDWFRVWVHRGNVIAAGHYEESHPDRAQQRRPQCSGD